MSRTIEERVLEMQFDNKDFESNVKTSMDTLEQLKKSLDFKDSVKSLEALSKAGRMTANIDSIARSMNTLVRRTSIVGIAGKRAIENITDGLMDYGNRLIAYTKNGIISGGISRAMNLEKANFQLMGLLKNADKVADVMKDVDYGVSGTAYSLDAAATVASQLVSSGIKAGDEMKTALRGISGVAAMTSSSYEEIGQVFTRVAGNGRVYAQDLLSLSSRGMNAAATLADYMTKTGDGTKYTEEQIRDMVSRGEISFKKFAKAMDDTFGPHAKAANETFTGSMSNVRAALARTGALFVSPLIVKNGSLVQILNTFREKINDIKNSIGPVADVVTSAIINVTDRANNFVKAIDVKSKLAPLQQALIGNVDRWKMLTSAVEEAGVSGSKFRKELIQTAKDHGVNVDEMIAKEGSFTKTLKNGWLTKDMVNETLQRLVESEGKATKSVENTSKTLKKYQKVVDEVWSGKWDNGTKRFNKLTKAGWDYNVVQGLVNKTVDGHKLSLKELEAATKNLSDTQLKNKGYTDDEIQALRKLSEEADKTGSSLSTLIDSFDLNSGKSGKELVLEGINNILESISTVLVSIKNAWHAVFDPSDEPAAKHLYWIFETFQKFTESLKIGAVGAAQIRTTFKAIFSILDIARVFIREIVQIQLKVGLGLIKTIAKVINYLISDFSKFSNLSNIAGGLYNIFELINSIIEAIGTAFNNTFSFDKSVKIEGITGAFYKFTEKLVLSEDAIEGITKAFTIFFGIVKSVGLFVFDSLGSAFKLIGSIASAVSPIIGILATWFEKLASAVSDYLSKNNVLANVMNAFGKAIEFVASRMTEFLEWFAQTPQFQAMLEALSSAFEHMAGYISDSAGKVKDFISNLTQLDHFGLDGIKKTIKSICDEVLKLPKYVIDGFLNGFKKGENPLVDALAGIANLIVDTIKMVLGIHSPATTGIEIGKNFIEGISVGTKERAQSLYKLVGQIGSTLVDKLESVDWAAVAAVAFGGYALMTMNKVLKATISFSETIGESIKNFSEIGKSISGMFKAISGGVTQVTGSISKFFESLTTVNKSKMILSLAVSIGLLAASVWVLAQIPAKQLWSSVGAIGALAAILAIFSKVSYVTDKTGAGMKEMAATVLSFAIAMIVLSKVVKTFEDIEPAKWKSILIGLSGTMGLMLGLMYIVKKMAEDNRGTSAEAGAVFLAFAVSMRILAGTFKIFSKLDASAVGKGVTAIIGMGAVFAALIYVTKFAGPSAVDAGLSLIAMAFAMKLMTGVIKSAAKLSDKDVMRGILTMTLISGFFAAFIAVSKFAGRHAAGAGIMLMGMAVSLGVLAFVINLIGGMNPNKVLRGITYMGMVMALFSLVMAASMFAGENAAKAGIMFLGLGGALLLLSVSLALLSRIDPKGLKRGVAAVVVILDMFALILVASKFAQNSMGTILAMTAAISALLVCVALLSIMGTKNPKGLAIAMASIVALMGMFALILYASQFAKQAIPSLAMMIAAIGLVGGILALMNKYDMNAAIDDAKAIGLLLTAMTLSFVVISKFGGDATKALPSLVIMLSVVGLLGLILAGLSRLDIYDGIQNAIALSILLGAFTAATVVLGHLPVDPGTAAVSVMSLIVVVTALGAFMAAVGALSNKFPEAVEFIQNGIPVLKAIAQGLGEIIGAFVGGMSMGMLPAIGSALSQFMLNVTPFIIGMKMINADLVLKAGILAAAMTAITAGGLVNSIISFLSGGDAIQGFSDMLPDLGRALGVFADSTKNVDADSVSKSASALKALSDVANSLPNSGGLLGKLFGENDIDAFGEKLVPFGEALTEYSKVVQDVNSEAITQSAKAAKAVVEVANNIPNEGGWLSAILGDNDMSLFGEKLVSFGQSLVDYSKAIGDGLNVEAIEASAKAAKAVVNVANAIPNTGESVLSAFVGDNDFGTFGAQMVKFGVALRLYSLATSGIKVENIDASVEAAKGLVELADAIPNGGGLMELFTGSNGIDTFGGRLTTFGTALKAYSVSIEGVSFDNIRQSASVTQALVNALSGVGNVNTNGINNFIKGLKNLGNALSGMSGKTSDLSKAGKEMGDAIAGGMSQSTSAITSAFSKIGKTATSAMSNQASEMDDIAKSWVSALSNGLTTNASIIKGGAKTLASKACSYLKGEQSSFKDAGKYAAKGFANGLESQNYYVKVKARAMARAAVNAAEDELDEHSPSKVFYSIGAFAGKGFTNALDDSRLSAYNSGKSMAARARDGLSEALKHMNSMLTSDLEDMTPIITPIMDLSSVENGVATIGDMVNFGSNIGLSSSVGPLSSSMASRIQNDYGSDIVSAINKLRNDLGNIGGNTYNVNGVTYDDGSNVSNAVEELFNAARIDRRS